MAGWKRDIRKLAQEYGFRLVAPGRGRHWRLVREGYPEIVIPNTPSDSRSLMNVRANIRKALRGTL